MPAHTHSLAGFRSAPVSTPPVTTRRHTVLGANQAIIAEFEVTTDEPVVCITWHGHLDSDSVVQVAREGLRRRQEGKSTPYVINDKSHATGDWTDAMPWLEYEWLPQTVAGGLKALAYVVSDDMYTYMAGFDFYQSIRQVLPLKLFSNVADARTWLLELAANEG